MTALQRIRFLLFAAAALVFATAFLLATISTAQTNARLAAQIDNKDSTAAIERKQASAERARLLDGQRRLEDKYDALLTTQRRMVSYLSGRGIFIPQSVLDGTSDNGGNNGSHSSSSRPSTSSVGGTDKQSGPKAPRPNQAASPLVDLGKVTKQVQDTAKDTAEKTDQIIKDVAPKPKATDKSESDKHPLRDLLKPDD